MSDWDYTSVRSFQAACNHSRSEDSNIEMSRKYLPLVILLLVIFFLLVLSTVLVPRSHYEIFMKIVFIALMIPIPTYLLWHRRDISKGKLLLSLRAEKGWFIYIIFLKILFMLITLFFIVVAIRLAWRGADFGILDWLLVSGTILFFGSIPIISGYRLIFTERGIIAIGGAYSWHRIKNYEWASYQKKIFALVIFVRYFGFEIPITIRGFYPDPETRERIGKILEEYIEK